MNASQSFDANTIVTSNRDVAKSVGAYELAFDMYLDADVPVGKETTLMQFIAHSSAGYAMLFSFKYNTDGSFRITQDRKDANDGVAVDLGKGLKIADGKWHNVRLVIEYNGTDSFVSLYIDNERVSRKATYFFGTAVTDGTILSKVTWRMLDNLESSVATLGYYTMYIDDMYFAYIGDLR